MSITSYAQNFEDVMLWRALGHIEGGTYIDVGAQDPVIDSVSLAFHEHGWHGIHVEPTPHYAELLRQQRPGDTVIQAAVGNGSAILHFFEIPGTGISTADATIAAQHKERGFDVHEITVTSVALSAVFDLCTAAEIHWLKIDVEGFEKQVLDSWGAHSARPWIVVIESTLPLTQIESHEEWEAVILSYGYSAVYFDGLNRYYVSDAHPELTAAFASPPNVFDGFTLNGTASATFHKLIEARYQNKVSETLAQGQQQQQALQQETDRLKTDIFSLTEAQQALSEQASQAKLEVQTLLSTHAEKEREVAVQLRTVQERAAQATAELTSSQAERERMLQAAHSVQAEALHQKIEMLQDKVAAIYANASLREQTFLEQFRLVKGEADALLRDHTEHERDGHAQLLAAQHQASLEKTELFQAHAHALRELQIQQAQREQTIAQQLLANQEEVRALHKDRLEREHQTGQEVAELVGLHHEEERVWLRYQAEQEKTNDRQLRTQQQELHQLQLEQLKREQALLEAHGRARQEAKDLLNAAITREQELHAQLLTMRQQAAKEKGELQQEHGAKESALLRQQAEQEKTHGQQLLTQQQEFDSLQSAQSKREQAVLEAHERIQQEVEQLRNAVVQREQELHAQLRTTRQQAEDEKSQLQQEYSVQEQALHRQHAEHQAALTQQLQGLRQELHRQQENKAQIEKELSLQIQTLQKEKHSLQEAKQLQTQEYELDLNAKLAEYNRVREASQALEENLQGEIRAEQQARQYLQDSLTEVKRSQERIYSSYTWRLTAPLRKLAKPFTSNKSEATSPASLSRPLTSTRGTPVAPEVAETSINEPPPEPYMPPVAAEISPTTKRNPALTLPELLAYNDHEFVYCAYQTLLGREPDPEGLSYYLGRIRMGFSKIHMIVQLSISKEGKLKSVELPGLRSAIQSYRIAQYPVIGWLLQRLNRMESDNPTERRLRAIENQIFLFSHNTKLRFDQMEDALSHFQHAVAQQSQSLISAPSIDSKSPPKPTNPPPNRSSAPEGIRHLTTSARNIYFKLRSASQIHAERAS